MVSTPCSEPELKLAFHTEEKRWMIYVYKPTGRPSETLTIVLVSHSLTPWATVMAISATLSLMRRSATLIPSWSVAASSFLMGSSGFPAILATEEPAVSNWNCDGLSFFSGRSDRSFVCATSEADDGRLHSPVEVKNLAIFRLVVVQEVLKLLMHHGYHLMVVVPEEPRVGILHVLPV